MIINDKIVGVQELSPVFLFGWAPSGLKLVSFPDPLAF